MKTCSFCAIANADQAERCVYCGRALSRTPDAQSTSAPAERTQPLHPRPNVPRRADSTLPGSPYTGVPGQSYGNAAAPYTGVPDTQGRQAAAPYTGVPGQSYGNAAAQYTGVPGQSYGNAAAPYTGVPNQNSNSAYNAPYNPAYPPDQGYSQPPVYPSPAPYAPPAPRRQGRGWQALLIGFGLVLLAACSLAVLSLYAAANRGRASTGIQLPPVGLPAATQEAPMPVEPSPWPTFTPEPTVPSEAPTQAPEDNETPMVEKLLSPECAGALDQLQRVGEEVKNNPAAPLNAEWRDTFNRSIADMKTYCGTLESASPVPGYLQEAQRNLSLASDEFDQANQLFKDGVENLQPGKLVEAGKLVGQALQHLGAAIDELKRIGR